MQYIQLQPQLALNVPAPDNGSLNLFLDNEDNLVKAVGLSGITSVVYGPTGNGVYVTGGTYDSATGITTLIDSIGGQIQIPGYFTSVNDVYITGGTFSVATGTLDLVRNDNTIEPITGFTTFTGGSFDIMTGTLDLVRNDGSSEPITGFSTSIFSTITKADLDSMIANSGLTAGNMYKITGVNTDLYGGTDIVVNAISSTEISKNGHGLFYNPDYNEYDIWSPNSTLEFTNLEGFFSAGEIITGSSGQTGTLIGLPGDYTLTFTAETGIFSAGTVITGYESGATALTTNLVSASYNIGDKVIWGGKVWKNVSGNSATVTNKIVGTAVDEGWQYTELPPGLNLDTFSITCNGETLTGQTGTCYNIHGDAGGIGCYQSDGYNYINFNGSVSGLSITASYTLGINQRNDSWTLGDSWEVVPYDDIDYVPTWDIIEYEYEHDNISFRKDSSNEVSSSFLATVDNWGWNSIKGMQWGGRVNQLTAKNPYLENLVNFNGNNMDRVTIGENGSMDCSNWNTGVGIEYIVIGANGSLQFDSIGTNNYISNINIGTNSGLNYITLANKDSDGYFGDINLGNSASDCGTYISNIYVGSSCSFYGINLDSSSSSSSSCTYIEDIYLNNNSRVFNIKIDQGGYMQNINLYNYAQANNIQIGQGSYIEDGYIYNDGQLHSIILEGGTTGSNQNYQGNWSPSRLSNFNIGTSSYMHDIKIGLGSIIENIFLDNVTGISGNYFHYISSNNNSNINNVYFNGNSSFFGYCSLGVNSYIESITLSGSCYFVNNAIGDDVYVNDIILQDKTGFYNNTLLNGTNFDGMHLTNCEVFDNIFKGGNVNNNYIYSDFYNNEIGRGFTGNHISGETYNNTMGNNTYNNDFLGDVFGNYWKGDFYENTIGDNFNYNQIGNYFNNNTIGENFGFGYTLPQGNRIGNNFYNNIIGEYFYNNTIPDNFRSNQIGDSFQWNIVNTEVDGICLSTGMLYDITTVNVFKNKNGDNRLSYYDEVDVLTVETLTEAPCLGGLNALDIPENDLNFGLVINLASFTITSSDFSNGNNIDTDTTPLGVDGVDGFENTASQNSLYDGYYGINLSGTSLSGLTTAYNSLGLDLNNSVGRLWYVTWGLGSSIPSGIVKFGAYNNGENFDIQTIDTSDTNYLTPNNSDGTSLVGIFLFPATFTIYQPLTDKDGWC